MANILEISLGERMLIRGVSLITEESWSLRNSLWMVMKVRSERLNKEI